MRGIRETDLAFSLKTLTLSLSYWTKLTTIIDINVTQRNISDQKQIQEKKDNHLTSTS